MESRTEVCRGRAIRSAGGGKGGGKKRWQEDEGGEKRDSCTYSERSSRLKYAVT